MSWLQKTEGDINLSALLEVQSSGTKDTAVQQRKLCLFGGSYLIFCLGF